jgi:cytochrome d ubiquinol oxidase subunit I
MGVGDSLAHWVFNNQPEKFAAIELVPDRQRRARDPARRLNANGTSGRDPIPGLRRPVGPHRDRTWCRV